jgi:cytosolic iron-sulfur protein assembly protein CIAO1
VYRLVVTLTIVRVAVSGDGEFDCLSVCSEHKQDVKNVVWHPTEEILASCSYDNTVKLWREISGDFESTQSLGEHTATVWSCTFVGDGSSLGALHTELTTGVVADLRSAP